MNAPPPLTAPRTRRRRIARLGVVVVVVVMVVTLVTWLPLPSLLIPSSRLVSWRGGYPATAQSTTVLSVEATRPSCAPYDGWLAPPIVTSTPWSVTITLQTTDAFADSRTCQSVDSAGRLNIVGDYLSGTYLLVQLNEPLGGRALFDGSKFPPAARPYR